VALFARPSRGKIPCAVLGRVDLPGRNGPRYPRGGLAYRADHGLKDHPAYAGAGLLRRNGGCHHAVHGNTSRHSGLHDPHYHWSDRRSRRSATHVRGALERRQHDRGRLDHHDPVRRSNRSFDLRGDRAAVSGRVFLHEERSLPACFRSDQIADGTAALRGEGQAWAMAPEKWARPKGGLIHAGICSACIAGKSRPFAAIHKEIHSMFKSRPGKYFEDFRLGQVITHATPRTVTAGDVSLYTALYGPRFAVQSSDHFARAIGYLNAPVDDLLV